MCDSNGPQYNLPPPPSQSDKLSVVQDALEQPSTSTAAGHKALQEPPYSAAACTDSICCWRTQRDVHVLLTLAVRCYHAAPAHVASDDLLQLLPAPLRDVLVKPAEAAAAAAALTSATIVLYTMGMSAG
jgi:hypothetical protein